MSLKYHLVQRRDMRKGAAADAKLYYPQIRSGEKISFEKLCEAISGHATASKGDVQIVISSLLYMLKMYLDLGLIVQVGELGNFRMTAGGPGVEDKKDFNVSMFKKGKVIFTPGSLLRDVANKASYEVLPLVKDDCGRVHLD